MLDIHSNIYQRLNHFININQVPNLLLHGPSGSGKRTIVHQFVRKLYNTDASTLVMYVECGHGKGIKFIRDEVNYFAKTNCYEGFFKTIVLFNADKLTIDAQSALRRSIELFCSTTRYVIVLHDKNCLLNPLTSRFCELYIPLPKINNIPLNLHHYMKDPVVFRKEQMKNKTYILSLFKSLEETKPTISDCFHLSEELYEKGISGSDIINVLSEQNFHINKIFIINQLRNQIKFEKLLIFSILNILFIRSKQIINNMGHM